MQYMQGNGQLHDDLKQQTKYQISKLTVTLLYDSRCLNVLCSPFDLRDK